MLAYLIIRMENIKLVYNVTKRFRSQAKFAILREMGRSLPFSVRIPKETVASESIIWPRKHILLRQLQEEFESMSNQTFIFELSSVGNDWIITMKQL